MHSILVKPLGGALAPFMQWFYRFIINCSIGIVHISIAEFCFSLQFFAHLVKAHATAEYCFTSDGCSLVSFLGSYLSMSLDNDYQR